MEARHDCLIVKRLFLLVSWYGCVGGEDLEVCKFFLPVTQNWGNISSIQDQTRMLKAFVTWIHSFCKSDLYQTEATLNCAYPEPTRNSLHATAFAFVAYEAEHRP
jgi:hypothetical protein